MSELVTKSPIEMSSIVSGQLKTFEIGQQVVLRGGIIPLWPTIVLMASLVLSRQLLQLNYSSPLWDKFEIPSLNRLQTKMKTSTHRIDLVAVFLCFPSALQVDADRSTEGENNKIIIDYVLWRLIWSWFECFRENSEKERRARRPMWLIEVTAMIIFLVYFSFWNLIWTDYFERWTLYSMSHSAISHQQLCSLISNHKKGRSQK